MERSNITNVWVEGQIDADGIALTLVSEGSGQEGAVVEELAHFTFEELQEKEGEFFDLTLSDNARDELSNSQQSASADIQVGSVVRDTRAPDWAEDDRMKVVNFADKRAGQYVVEDAGLFEKTVYDVNSPCDVKEKVVECVHADERGIFPDDPDETDIYAYPVSRVEPVEE